MIGVLGGTFDPIHFGHIKPAITLIKELGLNEIRFIPCSVPPHRPTPEAESLHRWNMVSIISGQNGIVADPRELEREGVSYSYDTILSLQKDTNETICYILGADALQTFESWYKYEDILTLCNLIVTSRPGSHPDLIKSLSPTIQARVTSDPRDLKASQHGKILLYDADYLDISSSAIRAAIKRGEHPKYVFPGAVWKYIKTNHLYEA